MVLFSVDLINVELRLSYILQRAEVILLSVQARSSTHKQCGLLSNILHTLLAAAMMTACSAVICGDFGSSPEDTGTVRYERD